MQSYMWIIITIAILLFFIALIVAIVMISRRIRSGVPPNSTMILNRDRSKFSGHAFGVLIKIENAGQSNRSLVYMKPIDLPYDERSRPIPADIKDSSIRTERMIKVPKGGFSMHRDVMEIFPESSMDLDDQYRNSLLGEHTAKAAEFVQFKDKAIEIAQNRIQGERSTIELQKSEANELLMETKNYFSNLIKENSRKVPDIGDIKK